MGQPFTAAVGLSGWTCLFGKGDSPPNLRVLRQTWCGLSERSRNDFSIESEIRTLEAVVDHLKLKRFALFSFSQSGPIGIAMRSNIPACLASSTFDTYARGEAITTEEIKASFLSLIRAHWGIGSRTLTNIFLPKLSSAFEWLPDCSEKRLP